MSIKYMKHKRSYYIEDWVEGSVVFLRWDVLRNSVWLIRFDPIEFRMKVRKCRKANKILKLLPTPWRWNINVISDERPKNRNQLLTIPLLRFVEYEESSRKSVHFVHFNIYRQLFIFSANCFPFCSLYYSTVIFLRKYFTTSISFVSALSNAHFQWISTSS